jgi:uncharacterized membrane protein YagU involved in acid resistance
MEVTMELRMHPHDWERRLPDWLAATVAGFAAGAAVMVLELFWATTIDGHPLDLSRMIAALAMGPDALQPTSSAITVMAVALITHYVLGIVFAVLLAAVVLAPFHCDSSLGVAMLAGAMFGAVLYLVNFYGMVQIFQWSWLQDLRGWATFIVHVLFGIIAAGLYWKFEREEPADRA